MVRGLAVFREHFRRFEGCFTLIGGAACDDWFASQGLQFRATKDLDLVLMIEVLDQNFIAAMRAFLPLCRARAGRLSLQIGVLQPQPGGL
jgi:hypothetical protein